MCEGQLDLAGVLGVGRPGYPEQGAHATTIGTSLVTQLAILKGRAASPSSRLALDTTQETYSHSSQSHVASPTDPQNPGCLPPQPLSHGTLSVLLSMHLSSQGHAASSANTVNPAPLQICGLLDTLVMLLQQQTSKLPTPQLLAPGTPHVSQSEATPTRVLMPYLQTPGCPPPIMGSRTLTMIPRVTPPSQESCHTSHSCTNPDTGLGTLPPRMCTPGFHSELHSSETSGNPGHKSWNHVHIHNSLHNEAG